MIFNCSDVIMQVDDAMDVIAARRQERSHVKVSHEPEQKLQISTPHFLCIHKQALCALQKLCGVLCPMACDDRLTDEFCEHLKGW